MKKKILLIMPSMFIGGAERSLLGLLEALDCEDLDVSLFLYRHEGEFLKEIPDHVNLLPEMDAYRTFDVPIKSLLFGSKARFGLARLVSKAAINVHCLLTGKKRGVWMSMQYTAKYLLPLLPDIPGEYDMAIMFLGVGDILIHKVRAKTKLTWCHTDYDTLYPDSKMDMETYSALDHVVAVSEACASKIRKRYPELGEKVIVVENILAVDLSRKLALESAEDLIRNPGEIILLSIGRYCEAKNFDNVPNICSRLHQMGLNVKWYIIGYGGDEAKIQKEILVENMEEHVILLGKKENPYPYIKNCDLYVQPSRYEGKSVTVREAQMLGKPVVITCYATSSSQLEDGVDGVIVPMDNEGCAEGIAALLRNPERMAQLSAVCLSRDYSNRSEIRILKDCLKE